MVLPDDHPEKWMYSEHTKVKHEILQKYLKGWVFHLGRFHDRICFYDCFAGRGEYENNGDRNPGSPILALRLFKEIEKNFKNATLIFIEKNLNNCQNACPHHQSNRLVACSAN